MRTPTLTLWDRFCRGLRFLNYEVHLIQHGMGRFARVHPWIGVPLTTLVLALVWSAYWIIYPLMLLMSLFALLVRPIELAMRGC